ncbi:CHRD domain-containing protein [Gramella sp. GC03-9]|uniref:CHRD domain-containing protein n=1 Tax=Christiangramia oceanisediminis TaxID=2920386 RepID=A0A9X2KXK5_9FLAO|nr:CHRD domain-containing protein [Gramella oceanisediminis]MCP9200134.1 CHRD domain-containing protein [Gramella oceanisediminis]
MKKLSILLLSIVGLVGCSDDDDAVDIPFEGETKVYNLEERSDSGVSGTATFMENEDGSTTVELDLNGTSSGNMHPAHIHFNSAAEGGGIAISLEPVDGGTGMSTTMIDMTDAGDAITYDELVEFDGYINVHLSADDLATVVAQTDIGSNELTGESMTYDLDSRDVDGISGTATFEERMSGETLVTLDIEGTPAGGSHPAHIHMGSVAEAPGDIAISLESVDGDTGMSMTPISETDAGEAVSYSDLITYDGYINVHLSADDLATIVAQGDIGAND